MSVCKEIQQAWQIRTLGSNTFQSSFPKTPTQKDCLQGVDEELSQSKYAIMLIWLFGDPIIL